MLKTIITGWTGGGLSYVKALLEASGVSVGTTLDLSVTPENLRTKLSQTQEVELSSAIVPYLHWPEFYAVNKLFIVRDPMRVLNRLWFYRTLHPTSELTRYFYSTVHNIKQEQDALRITCSYIFTWWDLAQSVHSTQGNVKFVKAEEYPGELLRQVNKFIPDLQLSTQNLPFIPGTLNSSGCLQSFTPSKLPDEYREGMTKLLLHLKYHERVWLPRGGHSHYVTPDWHS